MKHEIEARGAPRGSALHPPPGGAGMAEGWAGRADARVRRGRLAQPAGDRGPTPADSLFLCKATMLSMTALEASHDARFRGPNADLRKLAAQMVAILGRIDSECRQLAARYGVPVAGQLDHEHRRQLAALRRLSGTAFAEEYLHRFAMEAPLELMRLCGAELTDGSAEPVRAAAGKWLQALRSALDLARRVYFTSAR